jgi:MFS family permease
MAAFNAREPLLALGTVLAVRALRRSLLAYLLFNTAEWAVWVATLVFAYDFGGTTAAAVASLIQLLPAAAVAPLAASMGDRAPRERMLSRIYFAQSATMAMTVVFFMVHPAPPLILLGAMLVSMTISFARPVYLAALPVFAATPAQLTAANSVSTMVESLAVLLGPAVAAVLMEVAGVAPVFATFAVGMLLAALLVHRPENASAGATAPVRPRLSLSDWSDSLVELRARPHGMLLLGYVGVAYLLVGMADVLAVVLAFEILALGPAVPGALISAIGFGGVAGAGASILLAGRRRLGPALAGALLVAGVPFALAGLTNQLLWSLLLLAAAGAGKSFLEVAARTLLQRSVNEDVLARVFGLQECLMLLAMAVGALFVPLLVGLAGPRGAFVVAGLMLPLLAASTWRRLKTIDAEAPAPPKSLLLLLRVPMFGHLPVPVVERIANQCVAVEFSAGELVIRQGDHGGHFYVVESGQLEVAVDGQPRPSLGPGDSFGEIALMRDLPRTASITVAADARLWMLDRAAFLAAVTGSRRAEVTAARIADVRLTATPVTPADTRDYRIRRRR